MCAADGRAALLPFMGIRVTHLAGISESRSPSRTVLDRRLDMLCTGRWVSESAVPPRAIQHVTWAGDMTSAMTRTRPRLPCRAPAAPRQ